MVQIDNDIGVARSDYQKWTPPARRAFMPRRPLMPNRRNMPSAKAPPSPCCNYRTLSPPIAELKFARMADYNEALANLAQQEGSTLERNNINLETK